MVRYEGTFPFSVSDDGLFRGQQRGHFSDVVFELCFEFGKTVFHPVPLPKATADKQFAIDANG
ncbi:MAG: hypothetical protein RI958_997 [Actinomycetota bacterium]